jgi:hypothetical protein
VECRRILFNPQARAARLSTMTDDSIQRPLPDDVLEAAAVHLRYEIEQVAQGTYRTTPVRSDGRGGVLAADVHLGRVVHEAFLVHVRVLNEFLGKPEAHKEDVLAVDFCPEYVPRYPLTAEQRVDLDRRLVHLTLRRTDDFQWVHRRHLTTPVFTEFRAFLAVLTEHHPHRAEWVQPTFMAARRWLRETVYGWPDRQTA